MTAKIHTLAPRATQMLFLHVELDDVEPKVWREVAVPETVTLPKLHMILQYAMGWCGGHLHEFQFMDESYGMPDPDWGGTVRSERRVTLKRALGRTKHFTYLYDFGDGWSHSIRVRRAAPRDPALTQVICLGGENACPPEDVGGPWGYAEFLEIIADPAHEEHDAMLAWCGGSFDAKRFDTAAVDRLLAKIKV